MGEFSALTPSTRNGAYSQDEHHPDARDQPTALILYCVWKTQHRMWVGTDHGLFLYMREKTRSGSSGIIISTSQPG